MILRAQEFCDMRVNFENPSNITCVLNHNDQSEMTLYCKLLAGFSGNITWVTFEDIRDTRLKEPISVTMPICIAPVCAAEVTNFVETIKSYLHHQLIEGHPLGTFITCTFWGVVPRLFGGLVFTGSWFFFFVKSARVFCSRQGISMQYYYIGKLIVTCALMVAVLYFRIYVIANADDIEKKGSAMVIVAAVFQIIILAIIGGDVIAHLRTGGVEKKLKNIVWYIVSILLVVVITCMVLDFDYNSNIFKHYFPLEDTGDLYAYIAYLLDALWLGFMAEFLVERRPALYLMLGPMLARYF